MNANPQMQTRRLAKRRAEADQRLLAFLVHAKKLDAALGRQIEALAAEEDLSLIQALAARGILSEDEVATAIASGLRLPMLELGSVAFDDQVAALVKDEMALRCTMIPICKQGDGLVVAMANPFDQEAIRSIEFTSGRRVRPGVATRSSVLGAVESRYKPDKALRALLRDIPETGGLQLVRADEDQADLRALAEEAEGAPVVKMVNLCLGDALACGASDIHIEPGPNLVQVRYRINGVLEDVLEVPKWAQTSVVARIKIMAKLDITERRVPQDGHLRVRFAESLIDLRVSSLPTAHGEKIVIRILNPDSGLRDLGAIGFADRDLRVIREMIGAPEGMILVTGPTGSGKTTTLYSMLRTILSPEINIVTVENPIEYHIEGISQVDVNEKQGLTFATALRSLLRQDPDVILVGEIRDRETAEIAFQAAQTGHLVLSTLHTNDAASTLTRLIELGVDRHVLSSSLLGVVAQRLVRTVCKRCAETGAVSQGCSSCRGTGFAARTGLYEVLRMTPSMQKQIEAGGSETTLRGLAIEDGMTLLREDAGRKIDAGITTADEAARVVTLEDSAPRCPHCSHTIEDGFAVCPFCLGTLKSNCPTCGASQHKEWKTCPYCGPKPAAQPVVDEKPAPAPVRAAASAETRQGSIDVPHVLVVDDTEELRKVVRMSLERSISPLRCDEAANAYEALGKIETEKPHLIILDVMMPGLDGFEFCKRLRAKLSTALIPVIMLTACSDSESKELGFLAGTDDYLTKPFERAELIARVKRLLERTYDWQQPAAPPVLHS